MNTVSTAQNPKRQHVIPRLLLRNFQTQDEAVHAYNKPESRHFKVSANNVFVQKDRYTQLRIENDDERYGVEKLLGKIETAAAPIIKRIDQLGKIGLDSPLAEEEGEILKRFLIMFFLRTDHHADEMAPIDRYRRDFRSECFKQGAKLGLDQATIRDVQQQDWFEDRVEETWHDHCARIAAGLPPRMAEQIEGFIRNYGLSIAKTQDAATGFIVGYCGGVRVTHPEHPDVFHSWLPVSREVVIGLNPHPDDITYKNLEPKDVNWINWTIFEASDIVVANRRSDIDYVVRRWKGVQD